MRHALTLALALIATAAQAAETIPGPVFGSVVRVVDGDTFKFAAHIWLGLVVTVDVRLRGIDAPEVHGACAAERTLAAQATARLTELTKAGVVIRNVGDDKYFGRVVADVFTPEGVEVGEALIVSGVARPYEGGTRQPWC